MPGTTVPRPNEGVGITVTEQAASTNTGNTDVGSGTADASKNTAASNQVGSQQSQRVRVIREGVASYLPDIDPEETSEWLESFDKLVESEGPQRARYLMLRLLERAGEKRVAIPSLTSTDYVNTISTEGEPWFPGDEDVERRFRNFLRWNAAIMVHRAQRPGVGVGGHISTYASSAALYEVGFNHFFRGTDPVSYTHLTLPTIYSV